MSECRSVCEQLAGYLDGTLGPALQAWIGRHLDVCRPCREEEEAQRAAASILRSRAPVLLAAPLPPGLRTRCQAALAAETAAPPSHARRWFGVLVPAAVAAVLVVATAVAIVKVATARSNTVLAAELTADHLKCFKLFASGTSNAADPMVIEAMLRERYGFDVHVPPSSDAEALRLDGARRCSYADGRIPHVMYQAHGQNVSLFILEGVSRASADLTTFGHRARIWTRGPNTYVLVSSSAAGTLSDVVGYVQREVR